jgi:hypothetical protein
MSAIAVLDTSPSVSSTRTVVNEIDFTLDANDQRDGVRCRFQRVAFPRILDLLRTIPLAGDGLKGSATVFTHTRGVGLRYRLVLNSKGIAPAEVGLHFDDYACEMEMGYGYAVNLRLTNFTYKCDAFGFQTPKKASDEAARQFEGVLRLFNKFNEKKVRRRVARAGKLAFFPGVRE